jgi:hypothetical protein
MKHATLLAALLLLCPATLPAAGPKATPEEALAILKSLPPIARKVDGKKQMIQPWQDKTPADIRTMKLISPGGHIEGGPHLKIKGEDWRCFTAFAQLEKAELWEIEGADDTAFRHLGNLSQTVNWLFVEIAEVSDRGLAPLANLKNLRYLGIGWTKTVTDGAFDSLARITSLEHLLVSGCKGIKGEGVGKLTVLPKLKTLEIADTGVSDATLSRFAALQIEELNLSQNKVTAAGLAKLLSDTKNLPRLKTLTLKKVALSDADLAAVKAARPGLNIVR